MGKIEFLKSQLRDAQAENHRLKDQLVQKQARIDASQRKDCEKILMFIQQAKEYFNDMLQRLEKEERRGGAKLLAAGKSKTIEARRIGTGTPELKTPGSSMCGSYDEFNRFSDITKEVECQIYQSPLNDLSLPTTFEQKTSQQQQTAPTSEASYIQIVSNAIHDGPRATVS